eukprot:5373797-Amphidinium_carterae.1
MERERLGKGAATYCSRTCSTSCWSPEDARGLRGSEDLENRDLRTILVVQETRRISGEMDAGEDFSVFGHTPT